MISNPRNWFRSASWDAFWLLSGLWGPALLWLSSSNGHFAWILGAFVIWRILIGSLHLVAPIAMVALSPIFREARLKSPKKFIAVPLSLAGVTTALVLAGVFAPSLAWPSFALLSAVYVAWITWHFTAQHFGVLSLYRAKAEQMAPLHRLVDRGFCIITGVGLQVAVWLDRGFHLGAYLVPFEGTMVYENLGLHAAGAAITLTASYLIYEFRKPNASLPKMLYAVSVGAQPVVAWYWPEKILLSHILFYTFPHHMVEVGFQSHMIRRHFATNKAKWVSALGLGALMLGASVAINRIDFVIRLQSEGMFDLARLPEVMQSPTALFALATIYVLVFLHFLFGAYIYNLRNKDTGARVAELLLGPPERADQKWPQPKLSRSA